MIIALIVIMFFGTVLTGCSTQIKKEESESSSQSGQEELKSASDPVFSSLHHR